LQLVVKENDAHQRGGEEVGDVVVETGHLVEFLLIFQG
jgi:hypothetical protein